jgi:peptidoglycan hydrolase CwlO-like protein
MKRIKKIFLFIKKYWYIIATLAGVAIFLLIRILNPSSTKSEIQQKVDDIKHTNDNVIKDVEEEIKEIDKEIEEVKKNRKKIIKNKEDRDKKADKYFKGF